MTQEQVFSRRDSEGQRGAGSPSSTTPNDTEFYGYPGAYSDFSSLPSKPIAVYRTGPAWPQFQGNERVERELRPFNYQPLREVWGKLGEEIYKYFDSIGLEWTSIDPVCFAEPGQRPCTPHIWVGVKPQSVTYDQAKDAATHCKDILASYQLSDVEIAFRESVVR
ncbi:hypothetical protein C8Q80DRAFT_639920 [Daedaleopsis nitida]|nr:hypothetical protein C8Q80DRAFT_639920 [Daedaleopsis nitida]